MHMKNKILIMSAFAVLAVPCISFAETQSTAVLQQEIQSLLSQLSNLQAQLAAQQAGISCFSFKNNLSIGQSGVDVTNLQTVLQKDGESVNTSVTFDEQTASAVSAFQEKYRNDILEPIGLSAGTGYVGSRTIAKLNALFKCGTVNVTSTQTTTSTPAFLITTSTPVFTTTSTPAYPTTISTPVSPIVSLTESDSGKTIELIKDQSLTITLSNPGDGGYTFDDPQYDASLLQLDSYVHNSSVSASTTVPDNSASASTTVPISGNFGTDVWQFSPLKSGTSDLVITATRPWSGGGTVTMFKISVVVL